MTLLELRAAILSGPHATACAPYVHSNDMPKITSAEAHAKDQAIADILNDSGTYAASVSVPAWQAKKLLIKRGRWRAIVMAAADVQHPAIEAAYAAVALAEDARMDADFLDQAAAPLLAALVAANLLSAGDRAALEALSRRASTITAAEVSKAVRGPWEGQ